MSYDTPEPKAETTAEPVVDLHRVSYIERDLRNKLTALSTELFGRPSLWRKLLENGYQENVKPVNNQYSTPMNKRMHYTPESLLTFLEETKVKIAEAKAAALPKFKGLDDETT